MAAVLRSMRQIALISYPVSCHINNEDHFNNVQYYCFNDTILFAHVRQIILFLLVFRRVNVTSERDAANDSADARGFENPDRGDSSSLQND